MDHLFLAGLFIGGALFFVVGYSFGIMHGLKAVEKMKVEFESRRKANRDTLRHQIRELVKAQDGSHV